jgi:uncharacterized metal-binding protein
MTAPQKTLESPDGLAGQTLAAPCSAVCAKCGSADINRRHRLTGDSWNNFGMERERSTAFIESDGYTVRALVQCITHHCRCCHYDWETQTADAP